MNGEQHELIPTAGIKEDGLAASVVGGYETAAVGTCFVFGPLIQLTN